MSTQNWNPGTLLELSGYFWKTCALHAAVQLDVFSAIGEEALSSKVVAQKCDSSAPAMERLLNALVALDLLEKKDGRFNNSKAAKAFLRKDSPQHLGHIIMHHHFLMESWSQLDVAVRTGEPVRKRASYDDDQRRESFLMGMFNLAMGLAPKIVPLIDLSGRQHLLDLGGGPGTYAIHFCQHNPDLRATVFDLPTTQPFAEKTIARFDMLNRIDFVGGSYLEDGIPGSYDAAWLSHILHAEGPDSCQIIINKAVASLKGDGLIAVHDFYLNETLDAPLFPALFSLNMLLGTSGGRAYSQSQVTDMLAKAGIVDIRRIDFDSPNDSAILVGRRP